MLDISIDLLKRIQRQEEIDEKLIEYLTDRMPSLEEAEDREELDEWLLERAYDVAVYHQDYERIKNIYTGGKKVIEHMLEDGFDLSRNGYEECFTVSYFRLEMEQLVIKLEEYRNSFNPANPSLRALYVNGEVVGFKNVQSEISICVECEEFEFNSDMDLVKTQVHKYVNECRDCSYIIPYTYDEKDLVDSSRILIANTAYTGKELDDLQDALEISRRVERIYTVKTLMRNSVYIIVTQEKLKETFEAFYNKVTC